MNKIISILFNMFGIRYLYNFIFENNYISYIGIILLFLVIVGYFVKLKRQ